MSLQLLLSGQKLFRSLAISILSYLSIFALYMWAENAVQQNGIGELARALSRSTFSNRKFADSSQIQMQIIESSYNITGRGLPKRIETNWVGLVHPANNLRLSHTRS